MEDTKELKGKVRATIVMPKELHKKASIAAEEIGMTLTSYVNMCVYNSLQVREAAVITDAIRVAQQSMSPEEYVQWIRTTTMNQSETERPTKKARKK